jgi:hypothetical protein
MARHTKTIFSYEEFYERPLTTQLLLLQSNCDGETLLVVSTLTFVSDLSTEQA